MADDVPASVGIWGDEAEIGGRFGPAYGVGSGVLVWILCDEISGEAGTVRSCRWIVWGGCSPFPFDHNILHKSMGIDVSSRCKKAHKDVSLGSWRHLEGDRPF